MRRKKRELVLAGVATASVGLGILADPAKLTSRSGERAAGAVPETRYLITTPEGIRLASIFQGLPDNPDVARVLRAWRKWEGCPGQTAHRGVGGPARGALSTLAAWFNPPSVFACSGYFNSYYWTNGCGDCGVMYCDGGTGQENAGCEGADYDCLTGGQCHANGDCYH